MKGASDFTPEQIDTAHDLPGIISVIKEEIGALKGFITKRDVEIVRRSTKGLGTNEARLMDTLCNRTKKQLDSVDALYHKTYESSLLKVVSDDVSGNFGKMLKFSLMETDDFGAEIFTLATKGLGTSENVLIDLAHTHTNAELDAIKKKWEAKNNKSMLDCLNSELSGNARKILVMLLRGEKSESKEVDHDLAVEQADALHAARVQKFIGTDHDVFLEILGKQSRAQIQAIKEAYEKNHGMSLMRAVHKGCSGTYKKCLLACLFPTSEAYTAYALFKAFEGFGTDEDRVVRLLGGTDKRKMVAVADYYLQTYGKSIVEDLKDELSGNFLQAALCWAAGTDPTHGMEYVTAELSEDPGKEKDYAKALLQERANIRDFICQADSRDIREACKGLGTSDKRLVSIICGRTKPHLARVDQYYHSLFGMSLEAQIKHECFGVYRDFLIYTVQPEADIDALLLKRAMDGIGTNESMIIDVLAPASNERILAARKRHDQKYQKPLIDRLKSELSGSFEDVVLALIRGERQEDLVDEVLAVQQAKELHDAGIGKKFGTDKKTFIRILTQASRPQIQLIRKHYESNHGMSLDRAIKKECSGNFEKILLAMIMDPIAYYAFQIKKALEGMMADKAKIAHVLGANDKPIVDQIGECYLNNYGDSLMEALKKGTSGKFRYAVLTWVCASDPVHPENNLAEALEGIPDDEPGAEDEVVVDRKDKKEDAQPQVPEFTVPTPAGAPPTDAPPYYEAVQSMPTQYGGYGASPQYYGGHPPHYGGHPPHHGGPPPPHHGGPRPPPHHGGPPPPHHHGGPPPPPHHHGGPPPPHYSQFYQQPPPPPPQTYYPVDALGGKMASGMEIHGRGFPQHQHHGQHPPPPKADEDDDSNDSDDDSDSDGNFSKRIPGATPEQMAKLRQLDRKRGKAIMCHDREKVKRLQQKIRKLKREIENNA